MTRTVLTDGSGRWFDKSKAEEYDESTWWNGQNQISLATGSQWEHETLYRTSGGLWVKHSTSQWQGSGESWEEINHDEAVAWLLQNKHDPHEELAEKCQSLEM